MDGQEPEQEPEYKVPSHQLTTWVVLGAAVVLIGGLFGVRLEHQPETTRDYPSRAMIPDGPAELIRHGGEINDEYLPCSDCHEDEPTNRTRRVLEDDHEDKVLAHGDLWSLQCHDTDQRDFLRLADGSLVDFEDSWKLCTQCHGKKLADWRAGVHGKRTGHWRGPKEYWTCVSCHNPHSPPFEPLAPKPAPERPEGSDHDVTATVAAEGDGHGEG
jgi:hypothetical protein